LGRHLYHLAAFTCHSYDAMSHLCIVTWCDERSIISASELHHVWTAPSAIATTGSDSNNINDRRSIQAKLISSWPHLGFALSLSAKNGRRCLRALAQHWPSDRAGTRSTLRSSVMTFSRHHILSSSTRGSLRITADSKRRSVSRGRCKRKYKTC
jgi:hypothetical protein